MLIKNSVAIIDYGVGNHLSVLQTLRNLGYRAKISRDKNEIDKADVLVLPVGAFPKQCITYINMILFLT